MGAALAKAAYAASDALEVREHAPVRVFVFMALTALDSDPRPTFYGGRDALAEAIAAPRTPAGFRAVRNAVHALTDLGLISATRKAAPGRAAHYALLDGAGSPLHPDGGRSPSSIQVATDASGDAERPVNNSQRGTLSGRNGGRSVVSTGDAERTPKEEEEEKEETRASAPARTCLRHPNWDHSERCRACGEDRRRAEAAVAARRPSTMSERRGTCPPDKHRMLEDGTCMLCEYRVRLAGIA